VSTFSVCLLILVTARFLTLAGNTLRPDFTVDMIYGFKLVIVSIKIGRVRVLVLSATIRINLS